MKLEYGHEIEADCILMILGNLSCDSIEIRLQLLHSNIIPILLNYSKKFFSIFSIKKTFIWVLSNLCCGESPLYLKSSCFPIFMEAI